MDPQVWINSITFSDDTTVAFEKDDVIALVGPNNSGKTATLRAIWQWLHDQQTDSPVIKNIVLKKEGSFEDLIDWLKRTTRMVDSPGHVLFQTFGAACALNAARTYWGDPALFGHELAGFFCQFLTAEARLRAADPQASIAITRQPPAHPVHVLQRDDELEDEISREFRRAFGTDITVHRNSGNIVPIMVGERPLLKSGQDRISIDYNLELEKLPPIESQGDGMRSFLGILLFTMVGHATMLLIDEPEAFLHPPQARHLGKVLISKARKNCQLVVATHSGDVLRGLLDSESTRLRAIRIQRSEGVNVARVLDNERVAEVWSDPLLRYSNILDGLFHERVVLCEADADCRFYAAITDVLFPDSGEERKPDIMFTHCGGKQRLSLVIRALRDLDVPVSVITDFDVLNAEQPLREIVESAGGEWNDIAAAWREVKNVIDGKKPELSTGEVKKEIEEVLAAISEKIFPSESKKRIQAILKRSSPWSMAKAHGVSVLSGQQYQICVGLLERLASSGIFIVPVGEVEGFVRSAGSHGPTWVNEVLRKDLKDNPEFNEAKEFVREILSTPNAREGGRSLDTRPR